MTVSCHGEFILWLGWSNVCDNPLSVWQIWLLTASDQYGYWCRYKRLLWSTWASPEASYRMAFRNHLYDRQNQSRQCCQYTGWSWPLLLHVTVHPFCEDKSVIISRMSEFSQDDRGEWQCGQVVTATALRCTISIRSLAGEARKP